MLARHLRERASVERDDLVDDEIALRRSRRPDSAAVGMSGASALRTLFAAADTPEKMVALGEEKVRDTIKTIGLYRGKAKNVVELSRRLVAEHGGKVPRAREALEALPGVGRKTANVVLGNAWGIPGLVVDTHVARLSARLGLTREVDPVRIELALMPVVPESRWTVFSHWLILHGRRVCNARKPLFPAVWLPLQTTQTSVFSRGAPRIRSARASTVPSPDAL